MKRFVLMLALSLLAAPVLADDVPEFTIVIKDHRFTPAELTIPAGVKVKLIIDNQDATPEEFESHELNREKIVPGNSQAKIFVGPLEPGVYPFFGEFHEATAQGKLMVK
jgi:hypothetical protein